MIKARLIYDCSVTNSELYYASHFLAPDPFAYFEFRGKKYLVLDTLEFGRGKKEAKVDHILHSADYKKGLEIRKQIPADIVDIMDIILKKFKIKELEVPPKFPIALADKFRSEGYKLKIGPSPFFPKITQKNLQEKKQMIKVQSNVFKLFSLIERTLRKSSIKKNRLYLGQKILTSEYLKELITIEGFKLGLFFNSESIISCGEATIDPHAVGIGPLRPHEPIIVDIFPKSQTLQYCGDATRTFCKGTAPAKLKKMYNVVKAGQELGIKMVRAGINGKIIFNKILNFFEAQGYKTGPINGVNQGLIHAIGHGIGFEVHECPPFIASRDCVLKTGNVVSVEPGLYYNGIGGVRIEDLVYVTKHGCEILSYYPKRLEIL